MNNTGVAILVGVLAGVAGAVVVGMVGGSSGGDGVAATAPGTLDLSDLNARLERIEAALDKDAPMGPGALVGTGKGADAAARQAQLAELAKAVAEQLKPALQDSVKASVGESVKNAIGSDGVLTLPEVPAAPAKKKATMAEVAAELELSADEEEAVRRIAKETTDEFFKLMAGKDETLEDVRREFDDAQNDPAKKGKLVGKYMGRVMENIGGLMGLGLSWQSKMRSAVGAEKAKKIENDYQITDLDPYGLEDMFDFD